jgi:hypothetical protein
MPAALSCAAINLPQTRWQVAVAVATGMQAIDQGDGRLSRTRIRFGSTASMR